MSDFIGRVVAIVLMAPSAIHLAIHLRFCKVCDGDKGFNSDDIAGSLMAMCPVGRKIGRRLARFWR